MRLKGAKSEIFRCGISGSSWDHVTRIWPDRVQNLIRTRPSLNLQNCRLNFIFKSPFFLQPSEAPSVIPAPWKWVFPGITEPVRRCCGSESHRRRPPLPGHQLHRSGGHVAPRYRGRGPISGPEPVHLPPDEARQAQNRRDSSRRPKQNQINPPTRVPLEPLNNKKRRMLAGRDETEDRNMEQELELIWIKVSLIRIGLSSQNLFIMDKYADSHSASCQ